MKRRTKQVLIGGAILAVALAAVLIFDARKIGGELDSYRGVTVRYNGLLFFRSYGKNFSADGYYYGQKWQCVEFVKRFYEQAKGHRMPDVMGHARSFFDDTLPDGALNQRRGLVQFTDGSTISPRADDLVVFNDTKFGHVAIITRVGANSLEVIQQNIFGKPRQQFTIVATNGHYYITAPRRPAGWLRKN